MRVAVDSGARGTITNMIEAESVEAAQALFPDDLVVAGDGLSKGWVKNEAGEYEAPPSASDDPATLTKLQFITLGQTAGGMTDSQLVAAKGDGSLAAMWVKFEMATAVDRDDPNTQAAVAALEQLGYLPNGAQAVLDAWPVG